MDGREGIPSFYLNRGFRGSGSNVGSGNQGGGFQAPPPGFKTQSNPNLSPHGHSNMRLAPSIASSFHLEHNPPAPQPPPSFPHGFNLDGGSSGGGGGGGGNGSGGVSDDDGGGGGVGAASIPAPRGGNESIVKKKRGKPRKYAPDASSHMALGLIPAPAVASPDPTTPTPRKKRGRPRGSGRKQQLANVGDKRGIKKINRGKNNRITGKKGLSKKGDTTTSGPQMSVTIREASTGKKQTTAKSSLKLQHIKNDSHEDPLYIKPNSVILTRTRKIESGLFRSNGSGERVGPNYPGACMNQVGTHDDGG